MTAFEGRVALVTGGAGSVGAHLVRSLAGAGATVVLNCFHSYDAAKALAAELGGGVRVIRASVAKQDQVRRMFDEVTSVYGRLDLLVNNAAAGTFIGWDELTEEHLDQAYETNVKGALWCARAARPLLARSDAGCVVNVSSVGAAYAPANYLPVGLSKAALEALTRYLAAEFAPDGIRVNTASAGLLDNPVGRMFPGFDSMSANAVAATPMGRLATPADLADLVLLLASPSAAWVTGQTVVADGGMSLHRAALSPDPAPGARAVAARVRTARGDRVRAAHGDRDRVARGDRDRVARGAGPGGGSDRGGRHGAGRAGRRRP
ncbi:SDR family oxidoreductase [Planomonospora algeriensis]